MIKFPMEMFEIFFKKFCEKRPFKRFFETTIATSYVDENSFEMFSTAIVYVWGWTAVVARG